MVLVISAASGCRHRNISEIAAAVDTAVAARPRSAAGSRDQAIQKDVTEFYRLRESVPAWVSNSSPSKQADDAAKVIASAPAHGLNPADYDWSRLSEDIESLDHGDKKAPDHLKQLADFDIRLTTALFSLGRDVATGRTSPTQVEPRWKTRRTTPDLVATLAHASDAGLDGWLDAIRPPHPEYVELQKALAVLRNKQAHGGWPRVPPAASKRGMTGEAVRALRQRLAASGELAGAAATSTSSAYDQDVENAVRGLQEHHGLKATGIADPATIASLNVPIDQRIRQVELNLERWRWMPDDFGPRHLMINIPYFHVLAREDGKVVKDVRVVVGKPDPAHQTPIFSSTMTTVVFSPYWNIPDSIVQGETAPAVARNPQYLASHHIQILRVSSSGASPVDPSDVNWDDPAELKALAFRQLPGADNALGHVKFLFPNDYDVYLHDSPADELFARPGRALSHGCIRVEEPETMAMYILKDDPDWDTPKILAAMNAGVEKQVKLKQTIPVHIVYFTAWVDDNGGLHYQPDIYGYDAKQAGRKES
jgi:murein L,D-transpeptidase YcbB/YkuD